MSDDTVRTVADWQKVPKRSLSDFAVLMKLIDDQQKLIDERLRSPRSNP